MIQTNRSMTRVQTGWLLGSMMILLLGCGGGGGGGPTAPAVFIPDIGRIWFEPSNTSHNFSFIPANSGVESSTFTGEESQANGNINNLTGSYNGRQIQFTIQRPQSNVLFQGQFTDKDTMSLSSSTGNLTLVRDTS